MVYNHAHGVLACAAGRFPLKGNYTTTQGRPAASGGVFFYCACAPGRGATSYLFGVTPPEAKHTDLGPESEPGAVCGIRGLHKSKVKQKVSGCFRTAEFARAYCRISNDLKTMTNLSSTHSSPSTWLSPVSCTTSRVSSYDEITELMLIGRTG